MGEHESRHEPAERRLAGDSIHRKHENANVGPQDYGLLQLQRSAGNAAAASLVQGLVGSTGGPAKPVAESRAAGGSSLLGSLTPRVTLARAAAIAGRASGSRADGAPVAASSDLDQVQQTEEITRSDASMSVQRAGGRRAGPLKDAVVLKVTISGSGHNLWATYKGMPSAWGPRKKGGPTRYERSKGGDVTKPVTELAYAGPGGSETKGLSPKGILDQGSNRIAQLIKNVPDRVVALLAEMHTNDPTTLGKRTVILIRAHSRGAVAASRVATALKSRLANVEVELVMFDPVPGPGHKGKSTKLDLSDAGLSEFTLVYSVGSGYAGAFSPQAVYGAKRIILTLEKHSAKTAAGFVYQGKHYRGSNLNSLPPGVYVDKGGPEIVKAKDLQSAKDEFKQAQAASSHWTDIKRASRIKKVLKDYFDNAPAPKPLPPTPPKKPGPATGKKPLPVIPQKPDAKPPIGPAPKPAALGQEPMPLIPPQMGETKPGAEEPGTVIPG